MNRAMRTFIVTLSVLLSASCKQNTLPVPAADAERCIALHDATKLGDIQRVRELLRDGVPVNCREAGMAPLHVAAIMGQTDAAAILIESGGDVDARVTVTGDTPLYLGALNGNSELVELLIAKSAQSGLRNQEGRQPLHEATTVRDASALLRADPKLLDSADIYGVTPLLSAIESGHAEVALFFISKGADVNARDHRGFSPLYLAARDGYSEIVNALLAMHAVVNHQDALDGETPLHRATRAKKYEIMRSLVEAGADPQQKSNQGISAVEIARSSADIRAMEMLSPADGIRPAHR